MLKFWKRWTDRGAEAEAGFTLIEMSIVLVIIGLIIGGVLKGQELINSTRVKATVSQADSFRAAYNTFVDRYQALPGDYAGAVAQISATGVAAGGGNGVIGAAVGTAALTGSTDVSVAAAVENLNFWAHLAASRLISNVVVGTGAGVATAAGAGGVPPGRFAGTSWAEIDGTANGVTSNWLRFQFGTAAPAGALIASQAGEIDLKYDDSVGIAGTIMAEPTGAAGVGCSTAAAGVYNGASPARVCIMLFNLNQ